MPRVGGLTYLVLLTSSLLAAVLGLVLSLPGLENVAIAAAALIAFVGLCVHSLEVALLTFVAVRPIVDAFVYTTVAGLTIGQLWGIGLLGVSTVYLLMHRGWRIPTAPAALLITYAALTFVRPDLGIALDSALKLASWVLVLIVARYIATSREGQEAILRAMWATGLVLLLVVAIAVSQGRYGSAYYAAHFGAITGGYARPHALATLAVLIMPFVLAQVIVGWHTRRSIAAAGLLSLAIIASFVRTAYLALLAILVAYLIAGLRARTLRVQLSLAAIVAAFGVALYWFWADLVVRLADLPLIGELLGGKLAPGDGGGSGRNVFWGILWSYGTETPGRIGFGSGAGASLEVLSRYYGAIGAHNDFLEFLITGGVMLLGVYLAFIGWALAGLIRLYRDQRQSHDVHTCAIVFIGALPAFLVLSGTNGVVLTAGAVVMAVLIGLTRGMLETPGNTALDRVPALPPRKADEPAAATP